MPQHNRLSGVALACALSLSASAGVAQQAEPEDQISYRQNYMKAIGGHTGALTLLLARRISIDGHSRRHADALAALAADIELLFPQDSDFGETRARERIWQEWDEFSALTERFRNAATALAQAVTAGQRAAVDGSLRELTDTCKACHKRYRHKEN